MSISSAAVLYVIVHPEAGKISEEWEDLEGTRHFQSTATSLDSFFIS